MQSYVVSSTFTLKDEVSAAMERIGRLAVGISGSMDKLAAIRLTGLNKSIVSFVANMDKATAACRAFGESANFGFGTAAASAERMATAARSAAQSTREAASSARAYANAGGGRSGGGMAWGAPGAGRWAGGPLIEGTVNRGSLTLPSGCGGRGGIPSIPGVTTGSGGDMVPWVGGGGSGRGNYGPGGFGPGGGGGGNGGGGLGGALAGFAVSGAGQIVGGWGHETLGFMGEAVDAASKYEHQLEMMKIAGLSNKEIAESTKVAWEMTKTIMTSTPAENIKTIGELRSILGSTEEAMKFAPDMAKLQGVLSAFGKNSPDLAYNTMRAAEMVGGTVDPKTGQPSAERTLQYLDLFARAGIVTHGKVDPSQILNFAQTGGIIARNMSLEGLTNMIPIIQEMGGFKAGTAATSMNSQIIGGVMPQRVVSEWAGFGLLDEKKVKPTRTGVQLLPGAIKGGDVFRDNPVAWVESVFIPALEKHGITDRKEITEQIMRLFSRQTSQREAADMAGQLFQIHRDYDFMHQSLGSKSYDELQSSDPVTKRYALHQAYETALTGLGDALIPAMLPVMTGLTNMLAAFGRFANEYPAAPAIIGGVAVGLGAVMVVLGGFASMVGSIMILQAGLPMLVGGISSLTGVLVGGSVAGTASLATAAAGATAALWPVVAVLGVIAAAYEVFKSNKDHPKDVLLADPSNAFVDPYSEQSRGTGGGWGKLGDWLGLGGKADGGPMGNVGEYKADDSNIARAIQQALMGVHVVMDKEPVGRMVTDYQSREAQRPPSGTGAFDTRMSPTFPTSY